MNAGQKRRPLVKTFSACTYTKSGWKLGTPTACRHYKLSMLLFYERGIARTVVMGLN